MGNRRGRPSATYFLNVDLDICSKADIGTLVTALGRKVIVLHAGRIRQAHCVHLELAKTAKTADAAIRGFCDLIEALPKPERDLWNAAKARDFNIGVQAGTEPHSTEFALAVETLKSASELGARIVFTVYAPEESTRRAAKGSPSVRG